MGGGQEAMDPNNLGNASSHTLKALAIAPNHDVAQIFSNGAPTDLIHNILCLTLRSQATAVGP